MGIDALAGRRILVVGASGVLGATTAELLANAGAEVLTLVRNPERLAERFLSGAHGQADVRDWASLGTGLRACTASEGIHGVVNASGVVAFGGLSDLSPGTIEELFATNARGVAFLLAQVAPLLDDGGFFASYTGVAAEMNVLGMSAYCASKAAATSLLASATRELRRRSIRVLDIRAPHTETGLVSRSLEGSAPSMPAGLDPEVVARRVISALADGESVLPSSAFTTQ